MVDIDFGVVGLGGMGHLHTDNAATHGATIVGGADVVESARESFGEDHGVPTFESFETMYDDTQPDAVAVTTPNAFHEPAVTAALDRDIHVLCEKPLAASLEGAEAIADAAANSAAQCMVGFHSRYSASAKLFTRHRTAGRFGNIRHVDVNYVRRRGIPGVGSWFTDKELSGGGALIDIGVHAIDFGMHLAGFPAVEEVSGITRTDFATSPDYADPDNWSGNWDTDEATFDVDDSANAFVRCANGTILTIDVSWAVNSESDRSFTVRGTEAGAQGHIGGSSLDLFEAQADDPDHFVDTQLDSDLEPSGHEAEMVDFLEHVASGTEITQNTVEEGLAVQRIIDAIYRSSEAGSAVQL